MRFRRSHDEMNPLKDMWTLDGSAVQRFLQMVSTEETAIPREPRTGLLMMEARDCFDTDFYVGELLVTEAEVVCAGQRGYAMVLGDDSARAVALAAVDALQRCENTDLKKQAEEFLAAESARTARKQERERRLIATTKVSFEGMAKR